MDIQSSKIELVKIILNIENNKFIEKEKVEFWGELNVSQQEEIEKGVKRVEFNDFLIKIS